MVKPRNPEKDPAADRANAREGYGAGNPEPAQFKSRSGQKRQKTLLRRVYGRILDRLYCRR